MQGKLVAQDPNDPPARELLKEIEAEKRRMVKEGKIKVPKPLAEIKAEEVPYALPVGWEWPNHVHGIGVIVGDTFVGDTGVVTLGAKNFSPLQHSPLPHSSGRAHGTSKTIGSIVRRFKIGVTKWMRHNTAVHDVWQRNYWEHIVRNESELNRIREYISCNPKYWELDRLHSGGSGTFAAPKVCEPASSYGMEEWMV